MAARPQGAAHLPPGVDPEAVLRIDSLELRSRLVVEGFLSGLHRSPYHGFSVEFSEYRPYTPGDDLRHLDWKVLARSDRRYIKRFEDETNVRVQLLVDLSASMAFGHERSPKSAYALTLAATLARFLAEQRDAVGLLTFDEDVVDVVPARYAPGQLQRLLGVLSRAASGKNTDLVASLTRAAGVVRKRGVVVLLSDMLAPIEGLDLALGQLRARGQEVVLFRILDPAELDFPFETASMFEDLESGRSLYVDPQTARDDYRRRFGEHGEQLATVCREQGVDLIDWPTSRPLGECLFDYLQARSRRGRSVRRRSGKGARA